MIRNFDSWFPMAYVRQKPQPDTVRLAFGGYYNDQFQEAGVDFEQDVREFDVGRVIVDAAEQFTFETGTGEQITFRPALPADAAATNQFDSPMPLPLDIIGAMMNALIPEPNLSAAVDSNGDVHTMILETGLGLYARYGAAWIRMADISPIEQLDIVDVSPQDLDLYDEADQAGNMLHYRDLTPLDGGAPAAAQGPTVTTAPVTASAIIVSSAADLPDAIEWATAHPEAQWYVARRAKALGWDQDLPW